MIPRTQTAYGWDCETADKIQRWDDEPVKMPGPNEVLLKVEAAGLCQSDCHLLQVGPMGTYDLAKEPIPERYIMGHEVAGSIVAVGNGLENSDEFKVGGRFALQIQNACGRCFNCRLGRDNACTTSLRAYGLNMDGGFCQYVLIQNLRTLLPIPNGVSYASAAVASDSTVTPFHAINRVRADCGPGAKVLVVGCGGLGLNAVQILRNFNPWIVATDIKKELRERVVEFGADEYFTDMDESGHDYESFDVVFDFVGNQITSDICQRYVKHSGKYTTVGLGRSKLLLLNFHLARREVQINYSFGGTSQEQIEVMRWIETGKLKPLQRLVAFAKLPDYLDRLHHGQVEGRVTFRPTKL